MAQYDGSIRIKTEIDAKSAGIQLSALENRIVKTSDKIASLRSKMDMLRDAKIPTQEFKDFQKELSSAEKEMEKMVAQDSKLANLDIKIKKLSQSASDLAEKMKGAEVRIPTEEYINLETAIDKNKTELESLIKAQKDLARDGIGKGADKQYLVAAEAAERLKYELQQAVAVGDKDAYLAIEERLNRVKAVLQELMAKEPRPLGKIQYYYAIEHKIEDIKNNISSAEDEMRKLSEAGKDFTVNTDSLEYQKLASEYESVNHELEKQKSIHGEIAQKQAESVQRVYELKAQMNQLGQEGKAFTLGSDTEEFARLSQQLQYAESNLSVLNDKHDLLIMKQGQAKDGYKRLGDTAKKSLDKASKAQQKAMGLLGFFGAKLKSIISAIFFFNLIRKALNSMVKGIKEGFENLYNENKRFKNSVDSLTASIATLKNSLSAAFAPLVEIAIPYIQRVVEMLTRAINLVGQFIAAITGQKTYTKAIKQTTAAIKENTKASNKQLSSLDKLNNLTSDKGGDDDTGTGTMFEEVPIDSGILDFINKLKDLLKPVVDYAKKLKDIFMQGFWDGLGDWQYRWESIKDSLASIKDSLIDIFTDPAVVAAADKWAQSVAYMLGSLVGSMASIGLTIATNLLGGLAKYLEQNKERIKQYLISMFDIWADVNMQLATFFQAFAYVFEAFASEQAQQLTANIIGIFAEIFMGVTELASKLLRDIVTLITQPFIDNKEAFRTALEGFLGVLAEVTGTIKQGIEDTFAHLNEVYDAHIKPFFDSVTQGLSDLIGQFMEFWNGSVQPMLDEWAAKFDVLWQEHIQPCLDKIGDALGQVADAARELWEDVLQPAVSWVIENILPKVLPVLDTLFDVATTVIGAIFDAIGSLISAVADLITFIVKVIKGDWKGAWDSAKSIVKNVVDAIMSLIKGLVGAIGQVGSKIKSLFSTVSSSSAINGGFGSALGSAFKNYSIDSGIQVPVSPVYAALSNVEFPAYATGQVIPRTMKQHLAILGDNSRETEIVSPLSTMKQALAEALAETGFGGGGDINLNLTVECEGYQLLQVMQKLDREYFKQTGRHAFA